MNISHIHNCYGCGMCATVCRRKLIDIIQNADGFYEPFIKKHEECIDCGLCVEVCSYCHDELSVKNFPLYSYAAWSKDVNVRKKCSSGGISFEVGRYLLGQGYKVCGVRYNVDKNQAEHYIATTIEELIPSIGSKYIQSYTVNGFRQINRNEQYLVTGTPCQIDSFRRYVQKFHCEDNFILMDFFCHGVPSKLMWDKYVTWAEKKVGKLTNVSWRNKQTGWHDSWNMAINGESKKTINSKLSQGDRFYNLFLGDFCTNPACLEKCKYKYDQSVADIRIGDMWGDTYKENEEGVSAIVIFTNRGVLALSNANIKMISHPFNIVAEKQMKKRGHSSALSFYSWRLLNTGISINSPLFGVLIKTQHILQFVRRNINKLIKMF